jgi:hypothetical protein
MLNGIKLAVFRVRWGFGMLNSAFNVLVSYLCLQGCVTSGFRHSVNEICTCDFTQRITVVSYRRFRIIYQSRLQES